MSCPVASSTIFNTTNLVSATGKQSLRSSRMQPKSSGRSIPNRKKPRGHPLRNRCRTVFTTVSFKRSDPVPKKDTLRDGIIHFLLPLYVLDEFRSPVLRLDGNIERRRIGRDFRIGATASQTFEFHIDRIDIVAANESSVAGCFACSHLVVDAEREIGGLPVIGTRVMSVVLPSSLSLGKT